MDLSPVTVVIPAYEPDEKLLKTLESVKAAGFRDLIVVDDGSDQTSAPVFEAVETMEGVTLLRHPVNRGKGAALKTAFAYYLEKRPDGAGVVTADADGQHLASDIAACAGDLIEHGKMVIGCRDFTAPGVPGRSRFGNWFTSGVFRFFFRKKLSDTQTGLRAFPPSILRELLDVPGDRYEFETEMLFRMVRDGWPYEERTIQTVYLEENVSSHFHPLRDSLRIYKMPIRFAVGSLIATLIDEVLFYFLLEWLISLPVLVEVALAAVAARIVSAGFNYVYNRYAVFRGRCGPGTLPRYVKLALPHLLIAGMLSAGLAAIWPAVPHLVLLAVRLFVGACFFAHDFACEHNHVFADHRKETRS